MGEQKDCILPTESVERPFGGVWIGPLGQPMGSDNKPLTADDVKLLEQERIAALAKKRLCEAASAIETIEFSTPPNPFHERGV